MAAERNRLAEEQAVRNRPLMQDAFAAAKAQRERIHLAANARAKVAHAALAGNHGIAMPAVRSFPKSPPAKAASQAEAAVPAKAASQADAVIDKPLDSGKRAATSYNSTSSAL